MAGHTLVLLINYFSHKLVCFRRGLVFILFVESKGTNLVYFSAVRCYHIINHSDRISSETTVFSATAAPDTPDPGTDIQSTAANRLGGKRFADTGTSKR